MRNSFNKVLVWKCPESRQFRVSWTKCRTQTAATVQHAKILWTSCESVRHWHRHRRASPHRCEHSKWRGSSWYSIFNEIWFCLVFFLFFFITGETKPYQTSFHSSRRLSIHRTNVNLTKPSAILFWDALRIPSLLQDSPVSCFLSSYETGSPVVVVVVVVEVVVSSLALFLMKNDYRVAFKYRASAVILLRFHWKFYSKWQGKKKSW